MGRAKEEMMRNEEQGDLISFLERLIEREEIEDVALGIAKLAVDKGVEHLSSKQRMVIDSQVDRYKNSQTCSQCENSNVSSLQDYLEIADEGYCSMCQYDQAKYMKE